VADREGGGSKILRGLLTAVIIVAVLVLVIVLRSQIADAGGSLGRFVADHTPPTTGQKVAVIVYMVVAVLLSILFSNAGHFTAYGIAMGLGPLLWFLFWEGFPALGLHPTWIDSLKLTHMDKVVVITWAVVADVLITLVFVPLEIRENMQRRRHRLGEDTEN
jgi:hypothetical protein